MESKKLATSQIAIVISILYVLYPTWVLGLMWLFWVRFRLNHTPYTYIHMYTYVYIYVYTYTRIYMCVYRNILLFMDSSLGGTSGKEPTCQCRRQKKYRFHSGKIPWKSTWQPTCLGSCLENPMVRSLAGYSPWGHKASDATEWISTLACSL